MPNIPKGYLGKQYRASSDAAEHGYWSAPALFALKVSSFVKDIMKMKNKLQHRTPFKLIMDLCTEWVRRVLDRALMGQEYTQTQMCIFITLRTWPRFCIVRIALLFAYAIYLCIMRICSLHKNLSAHAGSSGGWGSHEKNEVFLSPLPRTKLDCPKILAIRWVECYL